MINKKIVFALAAAGALLLLPHPGFAQTTNTPSTKQTSPPPPLPNEESDTKKELRALMAKVNLKIEHGQSTESALAPEIQEFDELVAKHQGEKTDDVAQVLVMKAILYEHVLENYGKAADAIKQLERDFPNTTRAKAALADDVLGSLQRMVEAQDIQGTLQAGTKFPDFNVMDMAGKPLSLAQYKGKVVLIDFWATWCPLCLGSLPGILEAYHNYHAQGFEVIGISLDDDRGKLTSFIKEKGITWPQFFDGLGWTNQLAVKYGITLLPAAYLVGGDGKIIAKNVHADELGAAVAKALAAK